MDGTKDFGVYFTLRIINTKSTDDTALKAINLEIGIVMDESHWLMNIFKIIIIRFGVPEKKENEFQMQ